MCRLSHGQNQKCVLKDFFRIGMIAIAVTIFLCAILLLIYTFSGDSGGTQEKGIQCLECYGDSDAHGEDIFCIENDEAQFKKPIRKQCHPTQDACVRLTRLKVDGHTVVKRGCHRLRSKDKIGCQKKMIGLKKNIVSERCVCTEDFCNSGQLKVIQKK